MVVIIFRNDGRYNFTHETVRKKPAEKVQKQACDSTTSKTQEDEQLNQQYEICAKALELLKERKNEEQEKLKTKSIASNDTCEEGDVRNLMCKPKLDKNSVKRKITCLRKRDLSASRNVDAGSSSSGKTPPRKSRSKSRKRSKSSSSSSASSSSSTSSSSSSSSTSTSRSRKVAKKKKVSKRKKRRGSYQNGADSLLANGDSREDCFLSPDDSVVVFVRYVTLRLSLGDLDLGLGLGDFVLDLGGPGERDRE